ncbi:hypothetical protein ABS769_22470 [Xanthomonas hortorum]|uniref:hypothetical protein n=1 Tax=Xanthomonas hortorum TaxID=56454 RepID=UPI003315FA92
MSLAPDALQTHLDPVDAAGGKHSWRIGQAVVRLERGRQLANERDSQEHAFYSRVAAA